MSITDMLDQIVVAHSDGLMPDISDDDIDKLCRSFATGTAQFREQIVVSFLHKQLRRENVIR